MPFDFNRAAVPEDLARALAAQWLETRRYAA